MALITQAAVAVQTRIPARAKAQAASQGLSLIRRSSFQLRNSRGRVAQGGSLSLRKQQTSLRTHHSTAPQASAEPPATATVPGTDLQQALEKKDAPAVAAALDALKEAGSVSQWKSYSSVSRRSTSVGELTQMGIKNAEKLAAGSTRNEAAFLAAVVVPTSLLAVVAAAVLPGDWGFFVSYLLGAVSLVVLGVGSVAPGLLELPLALAGRAFGDYKERVLKHEAAHFLVAYQLGIPVCSYTLDIGKEHTNLVDEKLQRRIYEGKLQEGELDKLAAVAMAGMAAEGLEYETVEGQNADLVTLQRLMNRNRPPLSPQQQQNLTRWGVLFASSIIKRNPKQYQAVVEAMRNGGTVEECIKAIEAA